MGRKRTSKRRTAKDTDTQTPTVEEDDQARPDQSNESGEGPPDANEAGQARDRAKGQDGEVDGNGQATADKPKKRRRRRRSSRKSKADKGGNGNGASTDASPDAEETEPTSSQDEAAADESAGDPDDKAPSDETPKKKPKRRRSRRKKRSTKDDEAAQAPEEQAPAVQEPPEPDEPDQEQDADEDDEAADGSGKRKRRRSRKKPKPALKDASVASLGKGREMLINVMPGEECRIALTLDGRLEELFIERASAESHVGNIYKGRITNVEPSIQAAFVDFGMAKNGFLHISDLQPQYFPDHKGELEDIGRKTPRKERPPIQACLRRGQEVIVQITKEGIGTKGPTLNTYISLPGRFLVMMPGMNRLGVSRKIEEDDERHKMRDMLNQLDLPKGMGFILRTAGMNRTKRELQRDLNYLMRLWKTVTDRIKSDRAPATLYRESDLAVRTVRDTLETDVERIVVDDETTARKVRDFLTIALPKAADRMCVYDKAEPLFFRCGVEEEIEKLHSRLVPLPSGGSLIIESTEALVAIDVNSGKYRVHNDAEETALRINLEAAEEIARQLRLRDLGGLIICDFIDMRYDKNRRNVERALRDALKRHKERAKTLRMSRFGLIEITRQRTRPSISRSMHQDCPTCGGSGMIKSAESTMLEVMRMLQLAVHREQVERIEISVCPEVAFELQNRKRRAIVEVESQSGKAVLIRPVASFSQGQMDFLCLDARGRTVRFP